jgi:hypothetical protein
MRRPNPKNLLRLCPLAAGAALLLTSGAACNRAAEAPTDASAVAATPAAEPSVPAAAAEPAPLVTAAGTPVLIPRPKQVRFPSTAFPLGGDTQIQLSPKASEGAQRAAALLKREARERFGLDLPVSLSATGPWVTPNTLLLVMAGAPAGPAPAAPPKHAEGYSLRAGDERIVINGRDGAGVLWGAQTLSQLLLKDNDGPYVWGAEIDDWPSLKIRAVHLFHGQNALPFHKKLIDRIYSRYKMNALFIECEQVRWDHDPKVAPDWAGTPAQLREEVAYAKERGITVYPLFQSYGHLDKLLTTPESQKFAEDPELPYALNYTDPAAVQYMEGFINEADATFGAPGFHFGMDEVTQKGRIPFKSQGKTYAQLYVAAAKHWNDWAHQHHKRMFMWADQAFHVTDAQPDFGTSPTRDAAAQIRAGLPKDIVMIPWQYQDRTQFPQLQRLRQAGFKNVMAATWYRPGNIKNFTKAAVQAGALGCIQTTWAGYESDESILTKKEREQFEAMVLAADYFWNGGEGPAPSALPYRAPDVFARQWDGTTKPAEAQMAAR